MSYSWAQYLSYYYYLRAMEYAQAAWWTTQVLHAAERKTREQACTR